jgi:hypothetical protein
MISDASIRPAIAAIIFASQNRAQVYSWNALSHDLTDWPALFYLEATENSFDIGPGGLPVFVPGLPAVTHGWIVKRAGTQVRPLPGNRQQAAFIYDVWGFYGFRVGQEGDNSDEEFGVICDAVAAAFAAAPQLNLPGGIRNHDLLQFASITTLRCGEETLHFAQGRLTVHLCC